MRGGYEISVVKVYIIGPSTDKDCKSFDGLGDKSSYIAFLEDRNDAPFFADPDNDEKLKEYLKKYYTDNYEVFKNYLEPLGYTNIKW